MPLRRGGNVVPESITRRMRSERTPSVPGDARQRVQVGAALGLDDARYRRHRAGKAGLLGHPGMLPAPGRAIAERIGEMPDIAVERGLRNRPPHRHLAQRVGVLQVRQHGIVHRRTSDRHQRIGRKPGEIVPVHRCFARQRRKIDRIALAEIVDRERQIRRRQRAHPARQKIIELIFLRRRRDIEALLLAVHHQADAILARDHLLQAPATTPRQGRPGNAVGR